MGHLNDSLPRGLGDLPFSLVSRLFALQCSGAQLGIAM